MHLNTRILLAITAWASLNCALLFVLKPNQLPFLIVQFSVHLLFTICVLIPPFLKLPHRAFWIAFTISTIGMLAISMTGTMLNPLAATVTEFLFQRLEPRRSDISPILADILNYDSARWFALYSVLQLHCILVFGLISGLAWQTLNWKTPIWLIGLWLFYWLFSLSREFSGLGHDWTSVIGFSLSMVMVSIMPSVELIPSKWKPACISFGVTGCLGCIKLAMSNYAAPEIISLTLADLIPRQTPGIDAHLLQMVVLVVAALVGVIVQSVALKFSSVATDPAVEGVSSDDQRQVSL